MWAWLRRYWPLLFLLALQAMFLYSPLLDIEIALRLVAVDAAAGALAPWLNAPGVLLDSAFVLALLFVPWLLLASLYWGGKAEAGLRRRLLFLWLVLALAPGVLAGVLRAESGRAAPLETRPFGGEQRFTGVFVPVAECRADCSFVNRPALLGFSLLALAWVFGSRVWLWVGIAAGLLIGIVEIWQGRAWPSDVLFAFWIAYGTALAVAGGLRLRGISRQAA
jgi:membrane-associated PAP2 superfamily phosphatase